MLIVIKNKKSLLSKNLNIILVVVIYWTFSIISTFTNKTVFYSELVPLDATLFVTWFQCAFSAIICFLYSSLNHLLPTKATRVSNGNPFEIRNITKFFHVAILYTIMIASLHLCIRHVSVAFLFINRSLSTVFGLFFTHFILGESNNWKSILSCAVILLGFKIGVNQESLTDTFSMTGTLYGILGALSTALLAIYTKKALPLINQETWLLNYYIKVYSSFIFIPLVYFSGDFDKILNYKDVDQLWFWSLLSFSGLCALCVGVTTILQIKVTTALTHIISGTGKGCLITIIATYFYNESKSTLWWLSNAVIAIGISMYTTIKQLEMQKEHKEDQKTASI